MKKFEITFIYRPEGKDATQIDKIEADNLTSILGQFYLIIASIHSKLIEEITYRHALKDDDIPF